MEKTFASAKLSRDPEARALIDYLVEREREFEIDDGVLYYEFPLFRDTNDELHRAHVLLASSNHGVVIFGLVPGNEMSESDIAAHDEKLSQLESVLFGKCLQSRRLRKAQRELLFPLKGMLVAAGGVRVDTENTLVSSLNAIPLELASIRMSTPLDETAWKELRAILEGTKAIIRPRPREVPERLQHIPTSKVAILAELESEIANFDADQRRAAISLVDGPQRIRGLAGTGKTIVLAMKAAHIHLTDPSLDVLVTFYTKSLYDFIRRLITRFYRQFNDRDPDWNRVHVRHAWGGRYLEGVYYSACIDNDREPKKLGSVLGREDPFDFVCGELLRNAPLKQACLGL